MASMRLIVFCPHSTDNIVTADRTGHIKTFPTNLRLWNSLKFIQTSRAHRQQVGQRIELGNCFALNLSYKCT